ncbi:hypothetical protein [Micromonospora yangpuensis]|uniref:Uncharacterized protein n=1 Tax=Micromonospora yangpuensis TaxID=683228 RepID=A0A1C6U4F4_9ACTN|nr:hypothetical protein [Micromonospora yangpuensis]GGL92974.1 hypothetical protein GCM10012279_08340 [Micromonospora yangpuensis]SCL48803.1 hypothetical protein GA0070617_0984 [Micromonospora yangpuensis]
MCDHDDEYVHEDTLQAVIRHLLTTVDLDDLCHDAGLPHLVHDGEPVTVTAADTYHDASILTLDRGVWLELSDGSAFGLTVQIGRRPRGEVTLDPPRPSDLEDQA